MTLYNKFENGYYVEGPMELPENFVWPDGRTTFSFNLIEIETINSAGFYEAVIEEVTFNSKYERVVYSAWRIDPDNKSRRDYAKVYHSFTMALQIAFGELDKNREAYEVGGFIYNYMGVDVRILTDKASSQGKLTASQICANNGTRSDTDAWKFIKESDQSVLVVQLSNQELNDICNFVFRQIQDAYNLTSQIAWQMLGCGSTENLMNAINSGTIDLNPWTAPDIPWQY